MELMPETVPADSVLSGDRRSSGRLQYRLTRLRADVPLSIRRVITSSDEFVDPSVNARMGPMLLAPGVIRAEIVSAAWQGVAVELLDYSFPVATRGESSAQRIGVIAPLRRAGVAHVNGQTVAPGSVMHVVGGAADVAASSTGASLTASVSFDPATLERCAQALEVEVVLPGPGEFRSVRALSWQRLRSHVLVSAISARIEKVALSSRGLRSQGSTPGDRRASLAADERQSALPPHPRLSSVHIARMCEDYAVTTHFQGVTLAQLCLASNVSERRVRQAFQDCYGMSPTAYLRIAALHGVREVLLQYRQSVTR